WGRWNNSRRLLLAALVPSGYLTQVQERRTSNLSGHETRLAASVFNGSTAQVRSAMAKRNWIRAEWHLRGCCLFQRHYVFYCGTWSVKHVTRAWQYDTSHRFFFCGVLQREFRILFMFCEFRL